MSELYVVRHAQASFGADDYDVLSEKGHVQSEALGRALALQGVKPDLFVIGAQRRHRETFEGIVKGMGLPPQEREIHPGLNEFDFKGLLDAAHRHTPPIEGMHTDRRSHFRVLRDTVLAWERGDVDEPPESWQDFSGRVMDARISLARSGAEQVLAVSSGGAISQMIAAILSAPQGEQIRLQLQMKNCAVNRFVYSDRSIYFHGYNETPHINAENQDELLTYS
ncbi:MAG: histidine phosphatase family protein [Rhizobiaceae bacterium]